MCNPCVPCNNVICHSCMQYWLLNGHRKGHGPSDEELVAQRKQERESQSMKKRGTKSKQGGNKDPTAQGTNRTSRRSKCGGSYKEDEHGCSHDNLDSWQECTDISFFYNKKKRSERKQNANSKGDRVKELSTSCYDCKGPVVPSLSLDDEE